MQNEGLIKDSYELIIKEIQMFLTVSYLLMIGIGMLFNHRKYHEFGINIFEYSDLFGYLIAPFEDIRILLFSVATTVSLLALLKLDEIFRQKYPKFYSILNSGVDKKEWFGLYRTTLFLITLLLYLGLSAHWYGKITRQQIERQSPTQLEYIDGTTTEGILIGKTNEVIFLKQEEQIVAIPYVSIIKKITVVQ